MLALVVGLALGLPRGLIDVTAPPYSADRTGQADATAKLQAAINAGYQFVSTPLA